MLVTFIMQYLANRQWVRNNSSNTITAPIALTHFYVGVCANDGNFYPNAVSIGFSLPQTIFVSMESVIVSASIIIFGV